MCIYIHIYIHWHLWESFRSSSYSSIPKLAARAAPKKSRLLLLGVDHLLVEVGLLLNLLRLGLRLAPSVEDEGHVSCG